MIRSLAIKHKVTLQALGYAAVITALPMMPALAQIAGFGGDQLGMSTISTYYLATAKVIAGMAAVTVALLCMRGGHPIAAVVPVLGGALAIGKMTTILGWCGL